MTLYIRRMLRRDISQLAALDHEAFPTEWPPTNFTRELENRLAHYIVATRAPALEPHPQLPAKAGCLGRLAALFGIGKKPAPATGDDPEIIGYAGMWILADEAHITSIATRERYRGQGIGEALLLGMIEMAAARKARVVTLEARVSNAAAQNLYIKYGFHKEGVRKGYYLDNHEDAVIMTTDYLSAPEFTARLARLRAVHHSRWGAPLYNIE